MQKGGEVQGGTPLELTYLLLGRKLCHNWMWVVKMEVRGEGGTPVEHTYQQNMYMCAPFL